MMRLRRASVIASLFLLASAASAYAERAWVLWTQFTEAETGEPDRTSLNPTSAFESKRECDAARGTQISAANVLVRKRYGFQEVAVANGSVAGVGGGRGVVWHFHCLPEAVDPRGP
jgi:hypothetical protein